MILDTLEDTQEFVKFATKFRCQNSLFFHAKTAMGFNFIPDDIEDTCNWLQDIWTPWKPYRRNVMIQMSRDSHKSTAITQSFPSWALGLNPNLSILIISKVYDNAVSFLDNQAKRFESLEFKEIYGDWRGRTKGDKWSSSQVTISTRKINRKEPSIQAMGIHSEITSKHFDVIIADDMTTKLDMYSPAERLATARMFKSLFDVIDKQKGLLLVIGTSWHEDDQLERIKKNNPNLVKKGIKPWKIYYRPAEEMLKDGTTRYNFTSLPKDVLDSIRENKSDLRDYSANYQLKPIPDKMKIFSSFGFFDYYDYIQNKDRFGTCVQYIDPSLKDTAKSDYSAIITVVKDKLDGKMYVLDADVQQRKPSLLIKAIGENYEKYTKLGFTVYPYMETVMFQQVLKDSAVDTLLKEGKTVPIQGRNQHKNKIARITAIERHVSAGIVLFREDWDDNLSYRTLMDQLKNFPLGDHDDGPDALEGCITELQDLEDRWAMT